jgi:2-(1,2-epoxy-1,2-dihydrophenyl)acetyl-CoA isomerase
MTDSLVKLSRKDTVAILSLNRPQRHNALVPELLTQFLDAIGSDDCQDARVIILRAEGPSFSTGGDLLGFQQNRSTIVDYATLLVGLLNRAILAIYDLRVPFGCAVHGQVTGGSLGFLLASDWVVMHADATITPWYSEVGFSPDGGWTAMLPDIIGRKQASDWLTENKCHDADTCRALGLVDEVVDGDCDVRVFEWALEVADMQVALNPGHPIPGSRELARRLEAERTEFVEQVGTSLALKGIDRFLRKHQKSHAYRP